MPVTRPGADPLTGEAGAERPRVGAARAEMALLPDHDKMRSFDEVAQLVA